MLYALIDNFSLETLEKIETKETQIKWRTLYALIFLPPVTSTSHLNHSYTSMLKTKELEIFKSHLFQICELSLKSRKKRYPPGSMDPKSVGWRGGFTFFFIYIFSDIWDSHWHWWRGEEIVLGAGQAEEDNSWFEYAKRLLQCCRTLGP